MNHHFVKSVTVSNPLRVFFLCGSVFIKDPIDVFLDGQEYKVEDKRLVIQNFIENNYSDTNYRSIILEDKFLFSNSSPRHLNYNDINLKSLKSIELLTSLYSDSIFVIHESFSTAAEIGMFATAENVGDKLLVLTPNRYSVEEDFFSGFMKLAYDNRYYLDHNIKKIYYNPGIYSYHISENVKKLHTFFIDNEIKGNLKEELLKNLEVFKESKNITFEKKVRFNNKNYYHIIDSNKINVVLQAADLMAYLISFFTLISYKREFVKIVNMSELRVDNKSNRRKRLFKEATDLTLKYLKETFYYTLKLDIPNIETEFCELEDLEKKISFSVNGQPVSLRDCISYYLYIMYALSYIYISKDNTKFTIANEFSVVYKQYANLICEVKSEKKIWSRK